MGCDGCLTGTGTRSSTGQLRGRIHCQHQVWTCRISTGNLTRCGTRCAPAKGSATKLWLKSALRTYVASRICGFPSTTPSPSLPARMVPASRQCCSRAPVPIVFLDAVLGTSLPADCSPISSVSSHPCGRTRRPRPNSSSTICIGAIVVPWSGGGEDRGLGAETASPNDRSICAPSQISPVRPRCGAYCSLEQSRSGRRR